MQGPVKTALVTGGARRMGRAITLDLAAAGFAVAIHCNRSRLEADMLADEVARNGGHAVVLSADLADPDLARGLIDEVVAALGPLTLLVNNASVFEEDTVQSFDWGQWDRHFAIHVKAPVALSRRFAALLPPEMPGLVVNIIDQRVWKPTPQFFTYTLSKSALWTATRTMAQALAPHVRVNAIGPGPMLKGDRQDQSDFDAQVRALILQRGAALGEIGATIRYFWETPSVTGQMIALDGGQHLAWRTPDVTGMRE